MASTDLITYLNYMSTWETESDTNINALISEHSLFLNLGDFDFDSAVDKEFTILNNLATEVRDLTIEADVIQIEADAAAVASIWSFGLGMAAFAILEADEVITKRVISSKSKKLSEKLTTIDSDISSQINDNVKNYVTEYKKNNNLIASKAPKGLDTKTCRGLLLQFIAEVQKETTLDASNFKKYAESARLLYNSPEIQDVYDALDTLNLSKKTGKDVKNFMDVLSNLKYPTAELSMVRSFCIMIMFRKLGIANNTIKTQAEAAGLPLEEVEESAFETMDAMGKFITVVAVVMSVVDVVFNILDIVDVVEQCKKMCDKLNGPIKESYKSYFNGIKTSSQQYKAAMSKAKPHKTAMSTSFIRWSRSDKWLYGADISAKWTSKSEDEMILTISFGPNANPAAGVQKNVKLFYKNYNGNVILKQESVVLDLNLTWENPTEKQVTPKIVINGNILEGYVANVAICDVYPNITVNPAAT